MIARGLVKGSRQTKLNSYDDPNTVDLEDKYIIILLLYPIVANPVTVHFQVLACFRVRRVVHAQLAKLTVQ